MILVNGIGSFLPIPPCCVRCGVGSVVVSNRINLHYSTKAAPAKLFLALFSHYFPHMYPCRTSGGYLDDNYIFFASILALITRFSAFTGEILLLCLPLSLHVGRGKINHR